MPIIKSAKKALRQSLRRKINNVIYKQKIKELIKKAKMLAGQKKLEEAQKQLTDIYKILDKAAKKGIIKKNTASRKKSRIAKFLAKSKQEIQ